MIKLGNQEITLKIGSATCTVYLGDTMVESGDTPTPPTPSYKWIATYAGGGTTSSAECDASSAITQNEITTIGLLTLEIGSCVTEIGDFSFNTASNLTSVTIADSVTTIGTNVFKGCSSLSAIAIPNSVTSIGQNAFQSCTALTSINMPSGLTSISDYTFSGCTSLSSITIPNGVTSIGRTSFYRCSSLTSVTIPSGVTTIGQSAFYNCSGLTSITVLATVPPSISNTAFSNTNNCPIMVPCASVGAYKSAWSAYANRIQGIPPCFNGKWLATYTGGTTSSAQCNASSAITQNEISKTDIVAVEIGNCVTELSLYAFSGYDTLTSVTIPNSVTSIGDSTFWNCTSLTSITIPNSVTSIDKFAFASCTSLTSVTVLATIPPTLGGNAFYHTNDCPIYVPAASVSAYQSTWSAYASRIQAIP